MKTAGLLKMTFCILSVTHLLLYAAPQWNLIGLKEQNVNCLLFDYLLDGGSNLLAGADDGLYFYWPDDTNWLKYGEFPSLPVNDIKCAYRGRIVASFNNADYTAGRHMLPWDVESGYSSGLYIIRLSADEKRICKKFMLLRR